MSGRTSVFSMKASTGSPPSSCRNPQRSAWRRRGRMSNHDFCMSNRLNFGLRTSAVAPFPRQATTGGASSRIRSCHPRAVLFSAKASGIFQPSGKRRRSAALDRAGMGCSAEGAGQRHYLSGIFSQRNSQNANTLCRVAHPLSDYQPGTLSLSEALCQQTR